jgi:hypothetical protein
MNINDQHALNIGIVGGETATVQRAKANLRSNFLEEDNNIIVKQLALDLRRHLSEEDIKACIPITLDNFVSAFMEKICNVYDTPPVFKFSKEVSDEQKDRFTRLMTEVKINQVLQGNNIKMRLHNCILDYVRYNEDLDRVFIENDYTVGTCRVFPYPSFRYETRAVAYETYTAKDEKMWVIWDRIKKEHYLSKEEPKIDPDTGQLQADRIKIGDNTDVKSPGYWPWVIYRYREHNGEFWGNGMDWIVSLCRILNLLLTITTDDAIQQNIRLLIMNFTPEGTQTEDEHPDATGSKNRRFKVGIKYPIFPKESETMGKGIDKADAKIVQADLYLDNIVTFIQKLSDMAGSMQGVDSVLKREIESSLSGIALAIKNQPILNQWSKDIQILRTYDRELIKTIIEVNNFHKGVQNKGDIAQKTDKEIDINILKELTIEYQRPRVITDEKAEYELEKLKWEDGVSSPILYVMQRNPEMTKEEAQKFVEENLDDWNKINGRGVTVPEPDNEQE